MENPLRPGEPVLAFLTARGAVFWPLSDLALLRDEWEGRVEATHADGRVAHRPGPLPDLLHEVAPGVRVNPLHARRVGPELHLPGGWRLPAADLPAVAPPAPADPDAVLGARRRGAELRYLTVRGESPCPLTAPELLRAHPALVPAGRHFVHPGAVRALWREDPITRILLEGGHELTAGWRYLGPLRAALGPPEAPGRHRPVYARGLRDWPAELIHMPAGVLRDLFAENPVALVDQCLWQTFRRRPPTHGNTHRGYHYLPMYPLAVRAGVAGPEDPAVQRLTLPRALRRLVRASLPKGGAWRAEPPRRWNADRVQAALTDRLDDFVGQDALFTFREFGFRDPEPEKRRLGTVRPQVLLVAEKTSVEVDARLVAEMFGVSVLILGGFPTWIETEFLSEVLRGPVRIVSFCDFDPYGWHMPAVLRRMLARYGVLATLLGRLVTPDRFTPEELEILPIPLRPGTLVDEWVRESGGVGGRALALFADYLRPLERLVAAFAAVTGLAPVRTLDEARRRLS